MVIRDYGFQSRMDIITNHIEQQLKPLLEAHGWTLEVESVVSDGEYQVIKIEKNGYIKRIAILYSQSTRNEVYQRIEEAFDACLIDQMSYDPNNSFSMGFTKPIDTTYNFLNILKDWNHECSNDTEEEIISPKGYKFTPTKMYLSAENPSEQYWMFIKALRSKDVCKRFLLEKYNNLTSDIVANKSEGVSFLIQNACDYFEVAQNQNVTQRLLNLYYGILAFIEADILMNSSEYSDLKSVEDITKQGHGLYTYISEDSYSLTTLYTCLLQQGLFPKWLKVYGYNTSDYPDKRIKKDSDLNIYCYKFNDILNRIPELAFLMRMIDEEYSAGFVEPYHTTQLNQQNGFSRTRTGYSPKNEGTYIKFLDKSGCSNLAMMKNIIGELEQWTECNNDSLENPEYKRYSAFVKHSQSLYWYNMLNMHKSSYCSNSLILPLCGLKDDWIVYAVMGLYTFSIIVRYYPNIWRRIQFGEWDKYYTVCLQFAMIVEKVVPHIFYERISGQKLHVSSSIFG